MKILTVDDEAWVHSCIGREIRAEIPSIEQITAYRIHQAFEIIQADPEIEIATVDYSIPHHNEGIRLIQQWRELERTTARARAFICLVTGVITSGFPQYKQNALAAGADMAVGYQLPEDSPDYLSVGIQRIVEEISIRAARGS